MPVTPRTPNCHPGRKHCARGLCQPCYQVLWRQEKMQQEWEAKRRPCELCGEWFVPNRDEGAYCSKDCRVVMGTFRRAAERPGGETEDRIATRDRERAAVIARVARDRGCRLVHPKTSVIRQDGPYYSAWHRGDGLYIVRVRWPKDSERLSEREAA